MPVYAIESVDLLAKLHERNLRRPKSYDNKETKTLLVGPMDWDCLSICCQRLFTERNKRLVASESVPHPSQELLTF